MSPAACFGFNTVHWIYVLHLYSIGLTLAAIQIYLYLFCLEFYDFMLMFISAAMRLRSKNNTERIRMSREISDWMLLSQLIHTCTHTNDRVTASRSTPSSPEAVLSTLPRRHRKWDRLSSLMRTTLPGFTLCSGVRQFLRSCSNER